MWPTYHLRDERGFTFIEILIVIGIIGILASVVIQNLAGAKDKAQRAKTEASLRSAQTTAVYCAHDGRDLSAPNVINTICSGQGNWPTPVGAGWGYGDAGACAFDGDVSDGVFMFCATNGSDVIGCTQDGCEHM